MAYVDDYKTNEDGTVTRTRLYVKKDGTPYKSKEKTFLMDKPNQYKSHIPTGFLFAGKTFLGFIICFLIFVLFFRFLSDKPIPTFEGLWQMLQATSVHPFDSWFIETETLPVWISFFASIWNFIVWIFKGGYGIYQFVYTFLIWILF